MQRENSESVGADANALLQSRQEISFGYLLFVYTRYQFGFVSMLQDAYYIRHKGTVTVLATRCVAYSVRALICRQSRKYKAYALCADASADFITAASLSSLQTVHCPCG